MKALVLRGHGDLSQLETADVPAPEVRRPGDVRVRLRAAGLNHLDLWTVRGLPGLELVFPHIIGGDGAGTVDGVGSAVTRVAPGDRVMFNPGISCYDCRYCHAGQHSLCTTYRLLGEHLPGTLAEYIVVPHQNVFNIPDQPEGTERLSWAEAAAFSLVTLTAWRMLMTRAKLSPGESVLIWGIGGGVSGVALRIAKLAGAFVIATSSSDEKLARAETLGADVVLNHRTTNIAKAVRALTQERGVDIVIENVGEATWDQSVKLLAPNGRLVTCGATTGPMVSIDLRRLFWYQHSIIGSTMGSAQEYREIVRLLGQGKLRPLVDSVHRFENAIDAFRCLESGAHFGKLVVDMGE